MLRRAGNERNEPPPATAFSTPARKVATTSHTQCQSRLEGRPKACMKRILFEPTGLNLFRSFKNLWRRHRLIEPKNSLSRGNAPSYPLHMSPLPLRQTLAAGLLVAAPLVLLVALPAQTIITVSPQQCVWRTGDDPSWAASSLDESGWQPYAAWTANTAQPHLWVRCHRDLSSLRPVDQPALQVTLYAAYQIFADDRLIGAAGNLQSGAFTMDAVRNWPLGPGPAQPATIALRITRRIASSVPVGTLPPLQILAGDEPVLRDRRDALAFNQIRV